MTTTKTTTGPVTFPDALQPDKVTILAYGALLSDESSRLTFPDLTHFRHVRVRGLRRVFAHPHLFLISQGLVDEANLRLASLSAEIIKDHDDGGNGGSSSSFVVAAFFVTLNDAQRVAFLEREVTYDIVAVPYYELEPSSKTGGSISNEEPLGTGVICLKSTDEKNMDVTAALPPSLPYRSIWNWPPESGLLPADIYLRHCLLAVEKGAKTMNGGAGSGGLAAKKSFWEDTYLADRSTTLAAYLTDPDVYHRVMNSRPPIELAKRFGG